ncbi:MAG TPA: aminotransferase class V-fold PLP-dependent enzyme [Thermomicrobiales bacterium]
MTTAIPQHVRDLFAPAPGTIYLDTATYGLPPRPTVEALERAVRRWQSGEANWVEEWDREGEACRSLFAALIGARADDIALIPAGSVGVGTVAASLPEGSRVLVPSAEFRSVVLPMLAAQRARGIEVREVPYEAIPDEIGPGTHLVALSLTRAQSGETADLAAIVAAAREHGARVLLDATHALPFVSVNDHIGEIDFLVCHGYKHLLCPRGVAFMYVNPRNLDTVVPYLANWRTSPNPYESAYGGPLPILPNASRFDVSLAWHAWAGARPSLELLVQWKREGILDAVLSLSARLADGLGLERPKASLVCLRVPDAEAAESALVRNRIKCAARGGNIRLSPHVYTTEEEIDRAIEVISSTLATVSA